MIPYPYRKLKAYYGDLHSHCQQVGYGFGSVAEAYQNARLQLDFASVTAHAYWPDLPTTEPRLDGTVAYHLAGFDRAARAWDDYRALTEAAYEPGRFVTFPSFEWHSLAYGDHNVYFNGPAGEIFRAADLAEMRQQLRDLKAQGLECLLIPHHIGYLQGYRGLDWDSFTPEFSPFVEMFSMHGQAEAADAPYPYLHTMGPRDERSTVQYGLDTGRVFGLVGSTDHHSAFPGSYGYGRVGLWASALTREAVWEALVSRRVYALTGDRIELAFAISGQALGGTLPFILEREIEVNVTGGGEIDYVELLYNNRPVQRWSAVDSAPPGNPFAGPVKVLLEVGWGEKDEYVDWQVDLTVSGGELLGVEPRLRGRDIVAPRDGAPRDVTFNSWHWDGQGQVSLRTQTWGNPTIFTPATQGLCLEIRGEAGTRLQGQINDRPVDLSLAELQHGARSAYLGGFLSPAYCFHRAVPHAEYHWELGWRHRPDRGGPNWYYLRVRQKNGQWAWSSPIWVSPRQ